MGCTRCIDTIRMENKEDMGVAIERHHTRENGCYGQELKYTRRGVIRRIKIRCRA
jgi:hypothetical protein